MCQHCPMLAAQILGHVDLEVAVNQDEQVATKVRDIRRLQPFGAKNRISEIPGIIRRDLLEGDPCIRRQADPVQRAGVREDLVDGMVGSGLRERRGLYPGTPSFARHPAGTTFIPAAGRAALPARTRARP
jgi:hypothetical protein